MHRRLPAALALAAALVLTGCGGPAPAPTPVSAPATAPPPAVDAVAATRVAVPAGAQPEVVVPWVRDAVLVGVARDGQDLRPGLLRVTGETVAEVPLSAATGYGRSASWVALAADGDRVVGVGGDRGGAHGNVRWSVWTGGPAGVQEREQAFSTFGGWGAGELLDAVARPDGDVLVGSWQGDIAGLDVAVWSRAGEDWSRVPSAGSSLQGTRTSVVTALAATGGPDGLLLAGWVYGTAPGGTQVPVVWRAPGPGGPWTREALPQAGGRGAAMSARCLAGTCVAAGHVDGMLALWRSDPDREGGAWTRVAGLPPLPVDESARLPAPLVRPDGVDQVVADRGLPAVLSVDGDGDAVRLRFVAGPQAAPSAAAVAGGRLYLVTGSVPGTGTVSGTASGSGAGTESGADPSAAAAAPPAELWSLPW